MRKSIFTAVFASALAWPVACSSPTDDCSGVGRDGLALFVTDSASGAIESPRDHNCNSAYGTI